MRQFPHGEKSSHGSHVLVSKAKMLRVVVEARRSLRWRDRLTVVTRMRMPWTQIGSKARTMERTRRTAQIIESCRRRLPGAPCLSEGLGAPALVEAHQAFSRRTYERFGVALYAGPEPRTSLHICVSSVIHRRIAALHRTLRHPRLDTSDYLLSPGSSSRSFFLFRRRFSSKKTMKAAAKAARTAPTETPGFPIRQRGVSSCQTLPSPAILPVSHTLSSAPDVVAGAAVSVDEARYWLRTLEAALVAAS